MNKSKPDYFDRVLINLKRDYSRDEVISFLFSRLSLRDIEIVKLNAEIDYLKHELEQYERNQTTRNREN